MADPRSVKRLAAGSRVEPPPRRGFAVTVDFRAWLRALALVAFARAAATAGVASLWFAHRDDAFGQAWIVAWAVGTVLFELFAGVTLLRTARSGARPGVARALAVLAFGFLAIGVVLFVGAGLFARVPEWGLFWGLFDNLVRCALIVGILWPAILARAQANSAAPAS